MAITTSIDGLIFAVSLDVAAPADCGLDPAQDIASGNALAGLLLDPPRAIADGADQLLYSADGLLAFRRIPIVWHPTGFTHNRDRLLDADVARDFLVV